MDNTYDLDDEIDEEEVADFFEYYEDYVINKIVPMSVAFYLATAYDKELLSPCPIKNHINSAIDIFNVECDYEIILPKVKEILNKEYNLKIEDIKISKLVKINK